MFTLPKELTLDVSKWRCGNESADPHNRHGAGRTRLLNAQGFMCCLGQFCQQAGVSYDKLIDIAEPEDTVGVAGLAVFTSWASGESDINEADNEYGGWSNSVLSGRAININDDEMLSIDEKIAQLTKLFAENGYVLNVINR